MEHDYVGQGSLDRWLAQLSKSGVKRPFIIASHSSLKRHYHKLGWLGDALIPDATFSSFSPNPTYEDIVHARAKSRAFSPDFLIALGGGSAIDVAKGVRFPEASFAPTPGVTDIPFAALPTTAGSGSEATHFAAYYRGDEKHSLAHPSLLPDIAIIDPALSLSMPPQLTAVTGFDALAQAIESFWAAGATDASRNYATQALRLLLPNIENAVTHAEVESRSAMAIGANLAGKAINLSKTTAPHALSYYLTRKYGIAHGHAVALMMPYFFIINSRQSGSTYVHGRETILSQSIMEIMKVFKCQSPLECAAKWMGLMANCGLANTLEAMGISGIEEIRTIIANANAERLSNNPVRFFPEDLEELMDKGIFR